MTTSQHKATGLPVCTVCAHDDYASLRADLDAGVRVAEVAERYAVSVASLYRHRRSGHDAVRLIAVDDAEGLALADALLLMFSRAQQASEALYAKGDLRGGGIIADHALRLANALSSLGLDGDEIKAQIARARDISRRAYALSRSVEEFVERNPQQAEPLAIAAEAVGAHDLATAFREEDSDHAPDTAVKILEMSRS